MVLVKAKVVDSTHPELSKPIATHNGLTVLISVAESGDEDAERQQWLTASTASLRSAYGDSEPDYSATMVKESNPEYRT